MGSEHTQPVDIELDRQRELRIRWADDHTSVLPLAVLRRECPCAACRDEREQKQRSKGLPIVAAGGKQAAMVAAESAELVGHYALRIHWQDGHSAGIYEFSRLRALDAATTDGS